MSTEVLVQTGHQFEVTHGPSLGRLLDSLRYWHVSDVCLLVTFVGVRDGIEECYTGEVSAVSHCDRSDPNVVDITVDGPSNCLKGRYNAVTLENQLIICSR